MRDERPGRREGGIKILCESCVQYFTFVVYCMLVQLYFFILDSTLLVIFPWQNETKHIHVHTILLAG